MGRAWLIACTSALIIYSTSCAKKYDTTSQKNLLNHDKSNGPGVATSSFDRSQGMASERLPPASPLSMRPGFSSNEQYLSEHDSVKSRLYAESAFYDENRGFAGGRSRVDASGLDADTLSKTRRGVVSAPDLPIHYDFPAASTSEDIERAQQFSSARRDKITVYMSSTVGKMQVVCSSSILGGAAALFLAKSIVPFAANLMGALGAVIFFVGCFFRTAFGELVRALGLSLILVLQRTSNVRKKYPTWPYVKAAVGMTKPKLRPFPPSRSLWNYEPRRPSDANFSMLYSILAMSFVGSFCGGSVPIVPTWIGSLTGAGIFAFGCTLSSAKGDLCRTMGMRIVALLQELWNVQTDLRIIPKAAVVTSQVIDKMMVFDRKHKVKDKFLALVTRAYDQVTQSTSRVEEDQGNPRSPLPTSRREVDLDRPSQEDVGRPTENHSNNLKRM